MSYQYKNLPRRTKGQGSQARPAFGRRAAPPAQPPARGASVRLAVKAFCALMIVLAVMSFAGLV